MVVFLKFLQCCLVTLPSLVNEMVSNETGDVDGDGEPEFPTSSEFSTSCGCSTTTDIDTGTTDSPGSVTCNEGQAFHITSTAVPEAASCYSDTGLSFEDEVAYSDTGTTDLPQNVVQAFANGETGAPDVSASPTHVLCVDRTQHPTSKVLIRATAWCLITGLGRRFVYCSTAGLW